MKREGESCPREIVGRWVASFQNPVGVIGFSDRLGPPFDLEVARCLFEEGRARKIVHVEFGLWRHSCDKVVEGLYFVGGERGSARIVERNEYQTACTLSVF